MTEIMISFGLLLNMIIIVNGTLIYKRWSYIEHIPSQQKNTPNTSVFVCPFDILYSAYAIKKIDERKSTCTPHSGNEFLPGYDYYIRKISFKAETIESSERKESVQHFLTKKIVIGDKFRFVILKLTDERFLISFTSNSSGKALFVRATHLKFAFKDRSIDGTWGQEIEAPTYPFNEFKEYVIMFEVHSEYWQIFVDDAAVTTFSHRQPFEHIRMIEVTTHPGIIFQNKMNITGT